MSETIAGWEFMCLSSGNVIDWTEDRAGVDVWLREIEQTGGEDVGIASVGHDGLIIDIIWPLLES